ncbi:MAG: hypothetical protein ACE5JH_11295, partial [Acidobacteriota bacterium]
MSRLTTAARRCSPEPQRIRPAAAGAWRRVAAALAALPPAALCAGCGGAADRPPAAPHAGAPVILAT